MELTYRELVDHDPETGHLTWKERPLESFAARHQGRIWNHKHAGKQAGHISRLGYVALSIFNKRMLAHRLAWQVVHGKLAAHEHIDHINGVKHDNRMCNLRKCSHTENCLNRGKQRNCKSGYKGVFQQGRRWVAGIVVAGKRIEIGRFDEPELAHAAYCEAAKKYHGDFARTS